MNCIPSQKVLFAIMVLLSLTVNGQDQKYFTIIDELEKTIPIRMAEKKIVGVSIALVDENKMIWAKGFGFTNEKKDQRVNEETLFSVQSVSKPVTATAFMMEVQKGKIGLDEKLKKYLPDFTINSRFGQDDAGKITFRHLLSHRAGLSHEPPKGNNFSPIGYPFDEHVKSFSEMWLKLPVGKFYCYSNPGIDLAGYVISQNAGKSFEQYMRGVLLDPLNMTASTFDQQKAYDTKNLAEGFYGERQMQRRLISMLAAGGLYSNVTDLSKFISFHLNGARIGNTPLISEALLKEMYTVQFPLKLQTAGYALGIRTKSYRGGRLIHHRGGGYGYSTIVAWIPEHKLGIVILTNDGEGSSFIGDTMDQALSGMIKIKKGTLPDTPPLRLTTKPVTSLPKSQLKKFVGTYKSSRSAFELSVSDEKLYIGTDEKIPLEARSENEFTSPTGELFVFHFSTKENPDYIINLTDSNADHFAFNDSHTEPEGPSKPEWKNLTGTYKGANNDIEVITRISVKNGFLYTSTEGSNSHTQGEAKITEFKPGLFFSTDGEILEFNGEKLMVGNRPFIKSK